MCRLAAAGSHSISQRSSRRCTLAFSAVDGRCILFPMQPQRTPPRDAAGRHTEYACSLIAEFADTHRFLAGPMIRKCPELQSAFTCDALLASLLFVARRGPRADGAANPGWLVLAPDNRTRFRRSRRHPLIRRTAPRQLASRRPIRATPTRRRTQACGRDGLHREPRRLPVAGRRHKPRARRPSGIR